MSIFAKVVSADKHLMYDATLHLKEEVYVPINRLQVFIPEKLILKGTPMMSCAV